MQTFSRRQAVFLIFWAGLLVLLYIAYGGAGFALDDSWIHQTYGRNLAQYGEWAFVHGQPSAASTSPLYTVLLAVGYQLGIPFALWTHGLGAVALALLGLIGAQLAHILAPDVRAAPFWTGFALINTWHLLWAATSGMETLLLGVWSLVLLWCLFRTWGRRPVALYGFAVGVMGALATLTRPEGILLAGLVGLLLPLIQAPLLPRIALRWWAGIACGFGITIAPYLALNWQLTGGLLPNTAAAKFEQHAILLSLPYPERFFDLALAILAGGQMLLLVGVIWYSVQIMRQRPHLLPIRYTLYEKMAIFAAYVRWWLPLLWFVALIGVYAARLPAAYQHGRYVLPALPVWIVVGMVGLLLLNKRLRPLRWGRIFGRVLLLSTGMIYAIFTVWGLEIRRVDVAIIDGEMVQAAYYIRDHVSPDELLAIHDIGAVGYFAPRPLLDIAGLITPAIIPIVADGDALWTYLQAQDARYLLAFPDQLPNDNPQDERLCPLYSTNAAITQQVGQPNMTLYRLAWSGECNETP